MGLVGKQGIRVTLISFIGVIIGAFNTMFVFPHVLGAERHGLVMLILTIAAVITQFAQLGIPNTIIRFFPYLIDSKKYIYRLALQVPLMSILLIGFTAFFFGDYFFQSYSQKNSLFDQYQFSLLPLISSMVFFEVLLSISRSELKTVFPAVLRELVLRVITLLLLGAFFMSWIDFSQFISIWLSVYAFNVFLFSIYLFSYNHFKLEFGLPLIPNRNLAKKMFHYGAITLLTSSAAILVNRIDVLMLGHYLKLENVAFYTVAFFMATLIEIPARSILQIVKPLLAKAWSGGDLNEIGMLYKKTSINQMLVGLLLFIGIWMSIDDVLTFVPKKYQGIQMVFFYVGLAKLIDVSAGVNGTIIATSDRYRFDLYINLLLILVTVVTNAIFIPLYGIEGAAMATALALFIHNLVKIIVVYLFFRIQPFQMATIKLLFLALVIFFMVRFIPFEGIEIVWLRILIRSLLITLLFVSAVLRFSISEDFTALSKNYIRSFK